MDALTIALCLSIGSAVPWTIALFTRRGVELLLWDVAFATIGAALCAWMIASAAPAFGVVGLVIAGPVCAALVMWVGDVVRRSLIRSGSRSA